jgi:hypothetical protein
MIHGLDTGFLIAVEHSEHDSHGAARTILAQLTAAGSMVMRDSRFMRPPISQRNYRSTIFGNSGYSARCTFVERGCNVFLKTYSPSVRPTFRPSVLSNCQWMPP